MLAPKSSPHRDRDRSRRSRSRDRGSRSGRDRRSRSRDRTRSRRDDDKVTKHFFPTNILVFFLPETHEKMGFTSF